MSKSILTVITCICECQRIFKLQRTAEIGLTPEKEEETRETIEKIKEVKDLEQFPELLSLKICRKCGYEEFCYSQFSLATESTEI